MKKWLLNFVCSSVKKNFKEKGVKLKIILQIVLKEREMAGLHSSPPLPGRVQLQDPLKATVDD